MQKSGTFQEKRDVADFSVFYRWFGQSVIYFFKGGVL